MKYMKIQSDESLNQSIHMRRSLECRTLVRFAERLRADDAGLLSCKLLCTKRRYAHDWRLDLCEELS